MKPLRTKTFLRLLFLLAVLLLAACQNTNQQNKSGNEITDMLGRKVFVPEKVERIVGIRAGALRLISYMNAAQYVVGVEETEKQFARPYNMAHPHFKSLPSIGPMMGGDAEMIVASHPDVIFITYTTVGDADALQQKTGIPVVAIDATEMATAADTLFASLKLMGKILNRSTRVDSLITFIKNNIEELNSRTANIPTDEKPTVYAGGLSYSGAHGLLSTHAYFPPFVFVNAQNVLASINLQIVSHVKGTFIDAEQLLAWNPDVIFIDQAGYQLVQADLETGWYNNINALKNKRVHYLFPHNNYATNYELVLRNAWLVGKTLYPDSFADIDLNKKFDEISQGFLQCNFGQIIDSTNNYFYNAR
ncbi:MAG TPA: iron ABC transporter substrate-binding protein [Prolixibacteraceae bacterium]|nr:iron ABC transporter substrate-binding protein [Prolixibacteraceae bacterium]